MSGADPAEAARCRALWASVVQTALDDAQRDPLALNWFLTSDAGEVLALANLEPEAVRERVREIITPTAETTWITRPKKTHEPARRDSV